MTAFILSSAIAFSLLSIAGIHQVASHHDPFSLLWQHPRLHQEDRPHRDQRDPDPDCGRGSSSRIGDPQFCRAGRHADEIRSQRPDWLRVRSAGRDLGQQRRPAQRQRCADAPARSSSVIALALLFILGATGNETSKLISNYAHHLSSVKLAGAEVSFSSNEQGKRDRLSSTRLLPDEPTLAGSASSGLANLSVLAFIIDRDSQYLTTLFTKKGNPQPPVDDLINAHDFVDHERRPAVGLPLWLVPADRRLRPGQQISDAICRFVPATRGAQPASQRAGRRK